MGTTAIRPLPGHEPRRDPSVDTLAEVGMPSLATSDPRLYGLIADDLQEQLTSLSLVATDGPLDPSVLACAGSTLANRGADGYPGSRFHAGCDVLDDIEQLAKERAQNVFDARYANVQPESNSAANWCVYAALLNPGDTVLVPDPVCADQYRHGWAAAMTSRYFQQLSYGLDGVGRVDYKQLRWLAHQHRPRLIVCAAGNYPRTPDFARMRAIADEVGSYLLADISMVAGLVAAGMHPSPVDHAHVTTCATGGLLAGPAGGLILIGKDTDAPTADGHTPLSKAVQRSVFPLAQGTANAPAIAAKAAAFARAGTPQFHQLAHHVIANARAMATRLFDLGYEVVTYGTENHVVLLNVMAEGFTGAVAEDALANCGLLTGRSRVPLDPKPPQVGSGLRIGTTTLAMRGMTPDSIPGCAELLSTVLRAVNPRSDVGYTVPEPVRLRVRESVRALCRRFPLPGYPDAALEQVQAS